MDVLPGFSEIEVSTASPFEDNAYDETRMESYESDATEVLEEGAPNPWSMQKVDANPGNGAISLGQFISGNMPLAQQLSIQSQVATPKQNGSDYAMKQTEMVTPGTVESAYEFKKYDLPQFEPRKVPSVYCYAASETPTAQSVTGSETSSLAPQQVVQADISKSTHLASLRHVEEQRSNLYQVLLQYQQQQGSPYDEKNTGLVGNRRERTGRL